jgi:hypothetical protein
MKTLQASGYPAWVKTDEDKQRYIDDYFEREGIRLDPAKIMKNPGLRSLSKLALNSFWVSQNLFGKNSLYYNIHFSGQVRPASRSDETGVLPGRRQVFPIDV